MSFRLHATCFILLNSILIAFSQKLPEIQRRNYIDTAQKYYQNAYLPVDLIEEKGVGKLPSKLFSNSPTLKSSEKSTYYFKTFGKQLVYFLADSADKTKATPFTVYVDGKAPKSVAIIKSSNKNIENNHIYYGQGLNIRIKAEDDFSGVQSTYVSLDNEDFQLLSDQISLLQEGEFVLNYFSVDNVGNIEPVQKLKISVDFTAPRTDLEISGPNLNNVLSSNSKISLVSTDNLSSISATYYKIDESPKVKYLGGAIPLKDIPDGSHTIEYYSVDKVFNKEDAQSFDFFLDRTSPIVTTDILGDKFYVYDRIYFSGKTKLKLTAVDNKSGVKQLFYSLDGVNYIKYENPFYMPTKSGPYSIKYYALDNLGNQGVGDRDNKVQEYKHDGGIIYVDLTGPTLSYEISGPRYKVGNTLYLSKKSSIKLSGVDPESGFQKINYRFDSLNEEKIYQQPITNLTENEVKLDFFGYDNVNNRNFKSVKFRVDNTIPELTYKFSESPSITKGDLNVYPANVGLTLIAKDSLSGIKAVFYSINDKPELPYKLPLKSFEKNKFHKVKFRAIDFLENQAISEVKFYTGTK